MRMQEQPNTSRFAIWSNKVETHGDMNKMHQCQCFMCDKPIETTYAESRRINFQPTCSDSCKADLNNLNKWEL